MRIVLMLGAALAFGALAACNPATTSSTATTDTSTATSAVTTNDEALPAGTPCAADAQPAGETHAFTCANNVHFSVRFDTGATCAFVNAGGQTYKLGAAISGSGARFSDGTTQYWDHAPDAMLDGAAGGPYEECHSS